MLGKGRTNTWTCCAELPSGLCKKEYAPEDFVKYLEHIDSHAIEEAYGKTFIEPQSKDISQSRYQYWVKKFITNFQHICTIGRYLIDTEDSWLAILQTNI